MGNANSLQKIYTIVPVGQSTSALLFYIEVGEAEVYIGNSVDIEIEAGALKQAGYTNDDTLLSTLRHENKLALAEIQQGAKYYDIEEIFQGDKVIASTVRSVHESHGKLMPNTITFSVDSAIVDSETLYPKALDWIQSRANAFSKILESEGMKKDPDFILSSFIHALSDKERLQRFTDADRGIQTVTENMLA